MARLSRVSPIGVPQHIVQRGNNHQVCFASDGDMTEALTKKRVTPRKAGRPKKKCDDDN